MTTRKLISAVAAVAAILFSSACFSQVVINQGGITGQWYNPSRDGEGLFVEIVEGSNQRQIAVSWFTYDENGNQMWLVGNVVLSGDITSITIPVYVTRGPVFGPGYSPLDVVRTLWGTLTLTFPDCTTGLLTYHSSLGFGSGVIELTRLTYVRQVRCYEPPPATGLTPGTWMGDGVCFNVSQDGRTLTSDGSACDSGRAFDAKFEGTNMQGVACAGEVQCDGVFVIGEETFSCTTEGQHAFGTFTSPSTASGSVRESDKINFCSTNWEASPAN